MLRYTRLLFSIFLSLALIYLAILLIAQQIPGKHICTGFIICKPFELSSGGVRSPVALDSSGLEHTVLEEVWTTGTEDSSRWSARELALREIPGYVFEHAPYVHLSSRERFWPSDVADHLIHTDAYVNRKRAPDLDGLLDLDHLAQLNDLEGSRNGEHVFLNADYDARRGPRWLFGTDNIPRKSNTQRDERRTKDLQSQSSPKPNVIRQEAGLHSVHLATYTPQQSFDTFPENAAADDTNDASRSCRSIFGWSGHTDAHCVDYCDATFGNCIPSMQFVKYPHVDLKRRSLSEEQLDLMPSPAQAGTSKAPAILIVVPKEDGVVDAFWFFFYSFNWGPKVFNLHFGNHLGDWEHTLIRFKNGQPQSAFLSAHNRDNALSYNALEKYFINATHLLSSWSNSSFSNQAKRPVVYSALGSHAMYPTAGKMPYLLPWDMLHDQTDRGPLWDPSLNVRSYTYDAYGDILRASTFNPRAPVSWFHYNGRWGSLGLLDSDPRQYSLFGEQHYKIGPKGPKAKDLGRIDPCPRTKRSRKCNIRGSIDHERPRRLRRRDKIS